MMVLNEIKRVAHDNNDINVNSIRIEKVNEMKHLGIFFEQKLSFEKHIDYTCKKKHKIKIKNKKYKSKLLQLLYLL